MSWSEAFAAVGIAFAVAWLFRGLSGCDEVTIQCPCHDDEEESEDGQ
jgi:hypothetical protein